MIQTCVGKGNPVAMVLFVPVVDREQRLTVLPQLMMHILEQETAAKIFMQWVVAISK